MAQSVKRRIQEIENREFEPGALYLVLIASRSKNEPLYFHNVRNTVCGLKRLRLAVKKRTTKTKNLFITKYDCIRIMISSSVQYKIGEKKKRENREGERVIERERERRDRERQRQRDRERRGEPVQLRDCFPLQLISMQYNVL